MKNLFKLMFITIFTVFSLNLFGNEKEYVVGTNAEYPPFEYIENGVITGFDAELIQLIAEKAGFKYKWSNMNFDGLIPAIQSNKIDIVIAGMSITPERSKAVNFSIPYLSSKAAFVTNKKNPIKGLDDLENKKYGAELGTTKEATARKIKGAEVVPFSNNTAALVALKNGKVDGIVMDESVAKKYAEANSEDLIYVGAVEGEPKAIGFNKSNNELKEKVDKAIQELLDDGTIEKMKEKYGI